MQAYFFIGLFGVAGVLCRFGVDKVAGGSTEPFPKSTLLINIVGSFLAGLFFALAERKEFPPALQLGLLVGFCGGFTTFSAYALQAFVMMDKGRAFPALAYLFLSPILGLTAAALPILIMRKLFV